jgi:hypothetical protein
MFPPEIQLIFNAQEALNAGNMKDPRFDLLVTKLEERTGLDKEQVVRNIIQLAHGNIKI